MARSYGGISVKIDGDYNNKDIKRAISDLKALENDAKETQGKFAGMSKGMKMAGVAVAAAAAGMAVAVGKFAASSISAASDLEESQSKVTTVFGDQADKVMEWAETSATAFGQSKQQALEAAGTYGNLLQAFGVASDAAADMSMNMVQLAADLASFNNTSIDDAIQAIRSGLSGETEPLKRFGVALTDARLKAEAMAQGIYDGAGALDAGQKAQAAYAVILQDTSLAQGDFARTSDGLANTTRILEAAVDDAKATIGVGLVDALQNAAAAAGGAEGMAEQIDYAATRIGNMIAGAGALVGTLSKGEATTRDYNRRLAVFGEELGKAGEGARGVANRMVVFTRASEEGFTALEVLAAEQRYYTEQTERAEAAVDAFLRVLAGTVKPADHLADSIHNLRVRTDEATNAIRAFEEASGVQTFQIKAANKYYRDAAVRSQMLAEEQDNVRESVSSAGSSASSTTQKVEKMRIKFGEAAKGFGDAAVSIEGNSVKVSQALGTAFEQRTDVFRQVVQTQVGIIQSATAELDSYAESVKNSVLGSLDFTTSDSEGNPLTPEQIVNTLFGDIANRQAAVKTLAESNIMTQLPEALANKILALPPDAAVALANYFSANPTQLEQLTANYNALATYTETALGVPMANTFATVGDESAVKMIEKARDRIGKAANNFKKYVKRKLSTEITVGVRYVAVNALPGVSGGSIDVTTRANGGKAMAGLPTLVGERGPELLVPSVDSTVVRGEKTRSLLKGGGGGDVYLTVNAGMGTDGRQVGRQIVEALKQYERSNGPVPIKVA